MDLNKMGLAPMSNFEIQEVDGGGLISWVASAVAAVADAPVVVGALAIAGAVDAVYDLGRGIARGWNSVTP